MIFLVLWVAIGDISLGDEITSVKSMVKTKKYLYLLDYQQKTIWKTNLMGKITAYHNKTGSGPGEMNRVLRLRQGEGQLLVIDTFKRELMLFDEDLQFKGSIRTSGLLRDALIRNGITYLVYYDTSSGKMIHCRNNNSKENVGDFGEGLSSPRLLGFQDAFIVPFKEELIYVHTFKPVVYFFDLKGKLIQEVKMPGLEGQLMDESHYDKKEMVHLFIADVFVSKQRLFVKLGDSQTGLSYLYSYDIESGEFEKRKLCPYFTVSDQDGHLYEIVRNQFEEVNSLKLLF